MDTVEDKGLQAVGASCKELRDFRVYPGSKGGEAGQGVTEEGLAYIAQGCPELRSILYFCGQMTNAAVEAMAKGCPSLLSFRLCIMEPSRPDHTTREPMDEGFGAIVRSCASLRRLSLSGLLTDRAFEYIGMYAKSLERLSVAFAGESDAGLQHVLRGCPCLKKLEVRDSPFGDMGLLSGLHRLESMRSLWMSNCRVSLAGCHWLARHKPRLNVEVIQIAGPDRSMLVESLYVYRSVAGKRGDCPPFVLAF
jgi:transport inhibitor response 1